MSATDGATENVGGFEAFVPESLMPIWNRFQAVQRFRETYGEIYTSVLEGIVAVILTSGFLYWLFLFLIAGG
ncbi:hypothetical protein G3I44_08525 [Halogeometricum borinquense]|uniref:Uncharacterized protein n=1 Tax=Halogeometricum borinquense TaxID=60847 RepID=A0A6C0UFU2_9EURY|nr:hypothetical protein [Halogeometricum borinquense]QIB74322.1 hypothetical protein G3I44_08525 [Halogeometricum borinquense]